METFIWRGQVSTAGQGEFAMFTTDFGDGYSQTVPNGIDNHRPRWNVVIKGTRTYVLAAYNFILARKGQSFLWRAPLATVTAPFKCQQYNLSDEGAANWTLTMTFVKGNLT